LATNSDTTKDTSLVDMAWESPYNEYNPDCFGYHEEILDRGSFVVGRPILKFLWDRRCDLLVKADFIEQADSQYLGFTGNDYYPLKQYEIKKNTPYFTISVFDDATMLPVELPEDGRDYVVIEAVITRSLI
jgi:hypothetical protein